MRGPNHDEDFEKFFSGDIEMKRLEMTDITSNLLATSAVLLAITPFLLGDRLVFIVTSAFGECTVMFNQFSSYVIKVLG